MKKPTLLIYQEGNQSSKSDLWDAHEQFNIFLAFELISAIEMIQQQHIDLIVFANVLPQHLEIVQTLLSHSSHCRVVCQTQQPSVDFILDLFRTGVADVITESLSPASINSCLMRVQKSSPAPSDKRLLPILKLSQNGWHIRMLSQIKEALIFFGASKKNDKHAQQKDMQARHSFAPIQPDPSLDTPSLSTQPTRIEKPIRNTLKVTLLGEFSALWNGENLLQSQRKRNKYLLAYFLFNHKKRISKDRLMDLLWPKKETDSARNCLNVSIHHIRKAFQHISDVDSILHYQDERYFLSPKIHIDSDIEHFLTYWQQGRSKEQIGKPSDAIEDYHQAVQYYQGDLLEEYEYESWAEEERTNLREIYLLILERLCDFAITQAQWKKVITYSKLVLAKDNCREPIHRSLMRAYIELGDRIKAMKQFHRCSQVLREELETNPSKSTLALYETIKQGASEQY